MAESRLIFAAVTALILGALPDVAFACPNCAMREQTPGRTLLVIGMILLPWTVVGLTLFAIRKVTQNESHSKEEIS
jgi:hypothetical protein